MTSKVSIISQALNLLGLPPVVDISGFPGNNPDYAAANVWYDTLLNGILSEAEPWRFAMKQKRLNQLVVPPPTENWKYQYQLPTDPNYIVNYIVHDGVSVIKLYDIYEDKLYTDNDTVWMDYIFKPDPDKFPAYFVLLLIFQIATVLAMPITQKIEIAKTWATEARAQKGIARGADSIQTPVKVLPAGPLFYAHFGNGEDGRLIEGSF